ncbi:hypothetical protein JRI60_23205 [Archangium violaceum]|uniref:immunoglobulin domain-containing protein n=1 Tax=Archangium violaceum TaxID=83451 RepID=UPI00194DBAB6|nr:immunoglobulin domain-containing protein [Archangium violaceum]QRO01722.1 hypothetical protein JRI60_23205 [Archangium violaceum]
MKTLIKLIVPLLLGTLVACGDPDAGPVTVSPKTASVLAGDSTSLSATVQEAKEPRVIWSVEGGDGNGTITSSGVYTAPTTAGTYTVVATNAVDTSKKDTATITVLEAVVVAIEPTAATVPTAGSATFTARVTGADDTAVTWSLVEGAAGGSITEQGVYTAPTTPGTYTLVATSVADPRRKGTLRVNVVPVTIALTPGTDTVDQGAVVEFSASVTGTPTTAVTWSVEGGANNGSITSSGIYTAPNTAGTYTILATSVADPTKKGSATLTVRPIAVSLTPAQPSTHSTGSLTFSASVTGTKGSTAVTWSVEGGANNGSIDGSGVYTAPSRGGTYTVVATSVADPSKKATAQVTVVAVNVTATPDTATLDQGATATFTSEVTGTTGSTAVTWSVEGGASNGTITNTGVYTAPNRKGTYTVVATSVTDTTKRDTIAVTVRDVEISLTPTSKTLSARESTSFTATVKGTTRTGVTWSVGGGSSRGTISNDGLYTAPSAAAGRFTVVATSVADPTKTASATVTVPAATGISYEDPQGTGWRLVKNAALSTDDRLVLDLLAPAGTAGRGVDLTLSADQPRASWAKLASGDSEYALNHAFDLGSGPQLFRSNAKDSTLLVGAFQKGTAAPAVSFTGPVLSVALDLKTGPTLPSGPVELRVTKAHALPGSGTLGPIDVAVGALTAQ